MRIEQLYFFQEVAATRSITLAAKHLSITQQGLSDSISKLEAEFDVTLFVRSKQGVTLTNDGKKFLEVTYRLLNNYNDLLHISAQHDADSQILRIVTDPYMTEFHFNRLVGLYHQYFPGYQLNFSEEASSLPIIEKIHRNEADIGFTISNAPFYAEICENHANYYDNLVIRELHHQRLFAMVSKQSPLAQLPVVEMRSVLSYPLTFKNMHLYHSIKKSFPNLPLNVFLQTSNNQALLQAVQKHQAVGFICGFFKRSCQKLTDIVLVPIEGSDLRLLTVVSNRLQYLAHVKWFLMDLTQFFLEVA